MPENNNSRTEFPAPGHRNLALKTGRQRQRAYVRASKVLALLITSCLLSAVALAQSQPAPAATDKSTAVPQVKVEPAKPAAEPSTYAGAEACKTCHADVYTGWEKSPHWKQTYKEGGIAKHGCEDCHGPASSHVADPSDTSKLFLFDKASTKDINQRCLTCHAGGTQHMNAINSEHTKNDVSCVSCHSPHHAKESEFLLVKAQPELCYTCHLQQKAQFDMPFHHRVNEGLIQCSDCHNVHGTVGPKAGADFVHAGCGLLQMPHRQARTVCVRACADQGRWMPVVPPDARRAESAHAEAEQHEPALPAVPHDLKLQLGTGSAFVPQPGESFSVLPFVPLANSRVKLRCDLFQVGGAMNSFSVVNERVKAKRAVTRE